MLEKEYLFVVASLFFLLNIYCIKVTMIDSVLKVGNLSEWTCKLVHLILLGNRYQRS